MSTPADPPTPEREPSAADREPSASQEAMSLLRHELPESLMRYWWVFLVAGIVSVLVGVAALVWPDVTVLVVALLVGIWLVIWAGFILMTTLMSDASGGPKALGVVLAIVSFVAGVLILARPWEGVLAIALTFALWLLLSGITALVQAVTEERDRAWNIFRALIDVIAGIIIIVQPGIGELALALIVGLWLILRGILEIAASIALRRLRTTGGPDALEPPGPAGPTMPGGPPTATA
jgi:uncharacterized membrane protein HdeD (DUF308 family)